MTKILKANNAGLKAAVEVISRGGIVVYPTETAYGLGCDATNEAAVRRIFVAKGRSNEKNLPVIVADLQMAKKFFLLSGRATALVEAFMPGPLSIVVPLRNGLAKSISSTGADAFRISSSSFARSLSALAGKPVVSTSANLSGQPATYSASEAAGAVGSKVDLIIDAGRLLPRPPSTVVDLTGRKPVFNRVGTLAPRVASFLKVSLPAASVK